MITSGSLWASSTFDGRPLLLTDGVQVATSCAADSPDQLAESCWEAWQDDYLKIGGVEFGSVWLRIDVINPASVPVKVVLKHDVLVTTKLTLFETNDDGSWHQRLDGRYHMPKDARGFFANFPVVLKPGNNLFYIKAENAPRLSFVLEKEDYFLEASTFKRNFTLMTMGALVAFSLLEFVAFFGTFKVLHLILGIGALSSFSRVLVLEGVFRTLQWSFISELPFGAIVSFPASTAIFAPVFVTAFLYTLDVSKLRLRIAGAVCALSIIIFIAFFSLALSTTDEAISTDGPVWIMLRLSFLMSIVSTLVSVIAAGLPRTISHGLIILGLLSPFVNNLITLISTGSRIEMIINDVVGMTTMLAPMVFFILATSIAFRRRELDQRKSIENLNSKLKATLLEVEQKALGRAEKIVELEKKNALGEMASGVAHGINSPLSTIHAINRRVAKIHGSGRFEDPKIKSYFQKVEANVDRIFMITNGLKFYSDHSHKQQSSVDIGGVVRQVAEFANQRYRAKGFDIRSSIQDGCILYCNENHISQSLLNLIDLSVSEISKQGEQWVELGLTYSGDTARIILKDSSQEITEDTKLFIEKPFAGTTDSSRGWGLKLSIIKDLVSLQGGTISVGESPGSGKFILEFPIEVQERKVS